jgi:hypothetical protein
MQLARMTSLVKVICLCALSTVAQKSTVEYGNPSELRGVKKVFVDTGTNIELRNRIAEDIKGHLPDLVIVSAPEDSDVHLQFSVKEERDFRLVIPVGGRIGMPYKVGIGSVVKVLDTNRLRVLLSFRDARARFGERRPSTNFAKTFVEAYRESNR